MDSLPKYFLKKESIHWAGDLLALYAKLKDMWPEAQINEQDGIKFDWSDKSWIHVRPSNTEPLVRIFGEAKTQERIESLFETVRLTLDNK